MTIESVYKKLKKYDVDDKLVLKENKGNFNIELRLANDIWFYGDADYISYNVGKYSTHDHFDNNQDCQEIYDFFLKVLLNTKPLPSKDKAKLDFFIDL